MKAQFEVNGKKVTINASMETISDIQSMALKAQLFMQGVQRKHPDEKATEHYNQWLNTSEKAADYYNQWFHGLFDALDENNYYNRVK